MGNPKKLTKDNNNFWENLKSDPLFVEKTKLANTLYVENLNHLSRHESPKNYKQQIISKITTENNCFNYFNDFGRILK